MKSLTVLTSILILAVALSGSDPVRAQSATPTGRGSLQPASAGLYLIDTAAKTFKAVASSIAANPAP